MIERVENGAQARALRARLKAEHPEATHHCLAFVADRQGALVILAPLMMVSHRAGRSPYAERAARR